VEGIVHGDGSLCLARLLCRGKYSSLQDRRECAVRYL
jgi:hypothetical protein